MRSRSRALTVHSAHCYLRVLRASSSCICAKILALRCCGQMIAEVLMRLATPVHCAEVLVAASAATLTLTLAAVQMKGLGVGDQVKADSSGSPVIARSEATRQSPSQWKRDGDCFATLAMTGKSDDGISRPPADQNSVGGCPAVSLSGDVGDAFRPTFVGVHAASWDLAMSPARNVSGLPSRVRVISPLSTMIRTSKSCACISSVSRLSGRHARPRSLPGAGRFRTPRA